MAGTFNVAKSPSESEKKSLAVVATYYPRKWTVVLRDPSGGRGGSGGDTADLTVYQGGSTDNRFNGDPDELLNETINATVDVFTPEQPDPETVAKYVTRKLSSQANGVCVDLVNIPAVRRDAIKARLKRVAEETLKFVIVHADGRDATLYGNVS